MLCVPAPFAGNGCETGFRVHDNGEAHALEQRQVRGRVGVGDRLGEVEPLVVGVLGEHERACLTCRGQALEASGEMPAVVDSEGRANHLVEERAKRFDHEVERSCNEHGSVP
jgi:hypothetical protein